MKFSNIILGQNIEIDPSSSINNVRIGDNVKIAKRCSIFGSPTNLLEIGNDSYIGMNSILNGFIGTLKIGSNVSIAQNVNIMCDSGPNASEVMQIIFPIIRGSVFIGDHCWIGANVIVMPNIEIGEFSVIAANSFVNKSFEPFSVIGGTPAKLIRKLTKVEIEKLLNNDQIS
jgi:acetyltransferase-like isoleucine patch superfamily enzyme